MHGDHGDHTGDVGIAAGAVARQTAFLAVPWGEQRGMWCIFYGHPGSESLRGEPLVSTAPLHRPTVLHRSGWEYRKQRRGACLGCQWEGPDWRSEREAVEDAHDHCWPGWRDLPAVRRPGSNVERWRAEVKRAYPEGWLEAGGPLVTMRPDSRLSRHRPSTPLAEGYELAASYVVTSVRPKSPATHVDLVLDLGM
ncbi:DUF6349 family protein [Sphaerisporangium sp. NPDC051011]|uniref:DUF6349 family protein n=1 Tax=Sphaerisporangium sp. NPDC051011 TaxID=3155792 RepID=UPI0033C5F9BB